MPAAPFKFYDRFGRVMAGRISRAAKQSLQRETVGQFDKDTTQLHSGTDRRALMSFGRMMYENNSIVRGIVEDQSELVAAEIDRQFAGEDKVWGEEAKAWMQFHDQACDVRGELFPMATLYRLWAAHVIRDGDVGVLLCRGEGGYPMLQTIPAHRIRGDGMVLTGPWNGYALIDGVIVNEQGRPLAYRVYDERGAGFQDISAVDLKLRFRPVYADQLRGVSILGASLINFADVEETRRFEMVAQKLAASIVLAETNETGLAPTNDEQEFDGSTMELKGFETQTMEGGEIRYFRSGTGGKLEALRADRPTDNQQSFVHSVIRQACAGMGWSIDYFLDPTKVGGASMRVVVERINRKLRGLRREFLFPLVRTIDVWRVAVAIKEGFLRPTSDIFAWTYHGAADLTADAKYAMSVTESRINAGLMSQQMAAAEIGNDWMTVMDQKIEYFRVLQEKCKAAGVDPSLIVQTADTTYQLMPAVNPDPDAIPAPGAPGGQPVPEENQ